MGKPIPYVIFERRAIEGWLEEKAREGWVFTGTSLGRACFKKADPANTRYRVVPIPKGEGKTPEALRAVCTAPGWEFAEKLHRRFAVCRTDDESAREPRVDPLVWEAAMRREWRAELFSLIAAFLIMLLWALLLYSQSVPNALEFRLYDLANISLALACFYGFLALLFLICLGIAFGRWVAYARRERADLPQRSHTPERAKARLTRGWIVQILLFAAMLIPVFPDLSSKDINLWDYDAPLPFPLIAEINEGEWREMEAAQDGSWLFSNSLTRERRLLASTVLSIRQSGPDVPVEREGSLNWKSKFFYTVNYYEMRTEKLAAALAAEFSAEHEDGARRTTPEGFSVSYTVVDESRTLSLSLPTGSGSVDYTYEVYYQELILHRGKIVLRVHYDGGSDLRDFVPLYAAYASAAEQA